MDLLRPKTLKHNAAAALAGSTYSPHRLTLIHIGVVTLVSLVLALISFWLSHEINQTSGLSGIGSRAILETAEMLLTTANLVLMPFWEAGFLWAALCMARRQKAQPQTLLAGFRRFLPLLGSKLLQGFLLGGFLTLGCYLGLAIFTMTPFSAGVRQALEPYLAADVLDMNAIYADAAVMHAMLPAFPFGILGSALTALPMFYRLRFMDYIVLDLSAGPLRAFLATRPLMRGNRWKLVKLDLSFWWFYLLEGIIAAVCYGDLLLGLLGVALPMSAEVATLVFYACGMALQLGLYVWKRPYIAATYAAFYDAILPEEDEKNPLE